MGSHDPTPARASRHGEPTSPHLWRERIMLRLISMFGVMIALSVAALVPMASTAFAAQQQFFCVRAFSTTTTVVKIGPNQDRSASRNFPLWEGG